MASNPPPFQVEDNTDEDFFDKLVNDDDDVDFKITGTSSSAGPAFVDGNESDEVKAFANLSINEADTPAEVDENSNSFTKVGGPSGIEPNGENEKTKKVEELAEGSSQESKNLLASSASFEFDTLIHESDDGNVAPKVVLETESINKTSGGLGASGVKEVEWSAFNADSGQNDGNGFGSYSDFFSELEGTNASDSAEYVGDNLNSESKVNSGIDEHGSAFLEASHNNGRYHYSNGTSADQSTGVQDFQSYSYVASADQVTGVKDSQSYNYATTADQNTGLQDYQSSQYWESLYPGWKYDSSTGQWYQVDGYDADASVQENAGSGFGLAGDKAANISYLQQTAQSVPGVVAESGTTGSITNWNKVSQSTDTSASVENWNQISEGSSESTGVVSDGNQALQENNGYPPHMVFDPQYPGWYYDTIVQEWRSLDTYMSSSQSVLQADDQTTQSAFASGDPFSQSNDQNTYNAYNQVNEYGSQGFAIQGQDHNWAGSFGSYSQQGSNMWQPGTVSQNDPGSQYNGMQQMDKQYAHNFSANNHTVQQKSVDYGRSSFHEKLSQGQNDFSTSSRSQGFVSSGNFAQQFNQPGINQDEQTHVSNSYYSNQNSVNFPQQPFQGARQFSYAPSPARSSAGRPPHALVTFGFGGKLIVMKENSSIGSQNLAAGSISMLNLAEVINEKVDASAGRGVYDYFRALCQQSLPGPLTGGSVGIKELNKWLDDRISNFESHMDFANGEALRLLLSLLKIAVQHYGKLRSPFGTDTVLKESDVPESAIAKLFASAKRNGTQFGQYGAVAHCLQQLPSEGQMQATAAEVQSLLVSGRKKEALQCAQEGQLWGPALVLAAQLGDQYYVETLKQMALRQLVAGSPLRTLCLLIAGYPGVVFEANADNTMASAGHMPQQPAQVEINGLLLDDWEENLALITANRTKDDELVLIKLGDCLWKDRSNIIAAHICYLVAEANFELYSDSARLCLAGADHWKFPRTYASPEAIQRTEIYEYSKNLGNSQFVLLPFQPYKLVYANMLAEVGKLTDALKYCQAVLKSLKTGRSPEVETLRHLVSSFEERIKAHQQGGFSTNLAPTKLVGKLLNFFDSTAHRVVGGLPPPVPSAAGGTMQGHEHHSQSMAPRVSTSQSTMAMSSLIPSESTEPIGADGSRKSMHVRSVSEPDFGRSPRQGQVDSSKETTSTSTEGKASAAGGTSRFGRFGFGSQLLQKTVGLVLKPRQGRQAKLGDTNKFYYDEKLKRWVEEGAEPPAEETALPPPPPTAVFQNGTSDYNLQSALKSEAGLGNGSPEMKIPSSLDHNSGIPPLPPTTNQFSARGRTGVRSRYVDTFNQGGGNPTSLFHSPSAPSIKPKTGSNPKFFVPAPVSSVEQSVDTPANNAQDSSLSNESPSTSANGSVQSNASSSTSMQRFASMNDIAHKGTVSNNGSFVAHSRRTASWSGSFDGSFSPPTKTEAKPLGEVLGMSPSSFMPTDPSMVPASTHGTGYNDELQEVEL